MALAERPKEARRHRRAAMPVAASRKTRKEHGLDKTTRYVSPAEASETSLDAGRGLEAVQASAQFESGAFSNPLNLASPVRIGTANVKSALIDGGDDFKINRCHHPC